MAASDPKCKSVLPWLKHQLGPKCLSPLTSQDAKALAAAVQIVELYGHCDARMEASVAEAFACVVFCMQAKTQELAYHAVAHVLDWSNREELWSHASLPLIPNLRVCAYEPGGFQS